MSVNKVVSILPVNPVHTTKFGFLSLFAYANRLAVTQDIGAVYGLNICGKPGAIDFVSRLQGAVRFLDISPSNWWLDSSVDEHLMTDEISRLFSKGVFEERDCEVKRCSCGNVEYLGKVKLLGTGKTLIDGKYTACCHSQVISHHESILVTAPLPRVKMPEVFPLWAGRELATVLNTLAGSQLLVSRKSKRLFRIVSRTGAEWELDNDLLWWLYLRWLQVDGFNVKHLVVGASVIRQTGILLAFSSLIGMQLPDSIHCLPKVLFEPIRGVNTLDQIVARFGKTATTNALVWSALSTRKQFTLSGSILPNMCTTTPLCEMNRNYRSLLLQY